MEPESSAIEQLKNILMGLGYHNSVLRTNLKTPYGKKIDLVIYEFNKPKIVFEVKVGLEFLSLYESDEYRFNPAVRQAQSLSHDINAPYFAVSDGNKICWFEVDKEQGRPRLLQNPILPIDEGQETESSIDGKAKILNILFTLSDIERDHYPSQNSLIHVGIALLAHLLTERNNRDLENLLIKTDSQKQLFDIAYSGLNIDQSEINNGFYSDAFSFLGTVELLKIEPFTFIDALDEFISINISQYNYRKFKLPIWLSGFMANLAQIKTDDQVLDIYSNYGDGIAAIGRVNNKVNALSISPTSVSFLWDKLKRLVLGLDFQTALRIDGPQEYLNLSSSYAGKLDKIFVSPPFGIRVKSDDGFSYKSEDLFLELALNWVLPGGRIIALVPENLLFSQNRESIRQNISGQAWIRSIISLEQFMPGTGIKASIVVLDKKSPNNFMGRIMMCKIIDKDIPDSTGSRRSFFSSDGIKKILVFFNAHIEYELMANEERIWLIPFEDLNINSWSVNNYDPTKRIDTSSQYPTLMLQELAGLQKGSPLTLDKNGKLPVIGPGALRALVIDPTRIDRTSSKNLPNNPIIAKPNDVLIHAVGPNRGQAAVIEPDFENYFISRNIIVLHSISPLIIPAYLAIILNSTFVKKQLEERSSGSVISQLTIQRLKDLLVPVPDIATQRKIIEKISKARQKLVEIEQQVLIINSELKEQQSNFLNILNNIHLGGGNNA